MLMTHLHRLGLVCLTCRAHGRSAVELQVRMVLHSETTRAGDDVIEGLLSCPACGHELPIIDGVVVAVAELAGWAAHQLEAALRRHDVSPLLERLLGEVAAPGGDFDRERHRLSACVGAQWSDRELGAEVAAPGTFAARCVTALARLPSPPAGVWLDAGCAAGRGTFQLAVAGADLALGVDPDLALLRRAEQARRRGEIEWPRHRAGQTFDPAVAEVGGLPRERVGFLCAEPSALPFAAGRFDGALALDVLDRGALTTADPGELRRVVVAGGPVVRSPPGA